MWRAHPKKLHLQRKSLHLGRFYFLNAIWHCGRPCKIQGDRKLHIGRYQFSRFRENATSFSKHTCPKYKLQDALSWFDVVAKWWRMTACFQTNWTAKIRDLHLHPTPWHASCWGTTLTESAVHSLVHPCCASEDWIKPNRTEAIPQKSELCWSWKKKPSALAQRWTPGWLPQGNGSVDVGNRWQQQFISDNDSCAGWVQVAGFRDHNLSGAFWMEYLSDTLEITILKQNLDLQIMEHLMQSSKRHYSWYTLGRLCHNESSHPDSDMDQWTLHDRDTPISKDLKLCLFFSFHGSFPYDAAQS